MVVYILYSTTIDAFYIGQCDDLEERLKLHQDHHFTHSFTKRASDWSVFLTIECESRKQAVNIETHIKKMKSRAYIRNLLAYPEMIEKLRKRYA